MKMEEDAAKSGIIDVMERRAASDMLQDALHHFDSLIDGTVSGDEQFDEDHVIEDQKVDRSVREVAGLMEDLRNAVEATLHTEISGEVGRVAFSEALLDCITQDTVTFYRQLLISHRRNETENERVNRLQSENESLSLHVAVLSDQVELQSDNVNELQSQLNDAVSRLEGADARLQEEVAAKTSLETDKLQLMKDVSSLKIEVAQLHQQNKQDEVEICEVERRRVECETRTDQYKELIGRLQQELEEKERMVQELKQQIICMKSTETRNTTSPDEGFVQDDKVLLQLRMPAPFATSTPVSSEADNAFLHRAGNDINDKPQDVAIQPSKPTMFNETTTASNVHSQSLEKLDGMQTTSEFNSHAVDQDITRTPHWDTDSTERKLTPQGSKPPKSSSTPNLALTDVRAPLPSTTRSSPPSHIQPSQFHHRKKHGFRKFFTSFKLRRSRSTSLEGSEKPAVSEPHNEDHFLRGGVRATAGARLRWNPPDDTQQLKVTHNDNVPFQCWDTNHVCQWLTDIGLHGYVEPCRKWVKSGETLLRATNHDLEKELGVRHPLHKKKLMLHLQALAGGDDEDVPGVDHMTSVLVARWLDDIGLPQYKDTFQDACIDGRTLHFLTVGDAHKLGLSNSLHLLSIKRGLECLRACGFNPNLLKRRPITEEEIEDVSLWTNHRVMEWLRSADLAEYAPNLRGSGVHGALMVWEPLFTSETLASLLHIPMSKTLLRRHLAAKLNELLPQESSQDKKKRSREPGHQPLNVTAKYKIGRGAFGGFSRLRGMGSGAAYREFTHGEYVCPMLSSSKKSMSSHRSELERRMKVEEAREKQKFALVDDDGSRTSDGLEVVELNEKTTREINAFSAQMKNLTSNWTEP